MLRGGQRFEPVLRGVGPDRNIYKSPGVGVPLIKDCEGIGIKGHLAPNSPRPLGGLGMGPRRELGPWELAEGGSWESLKDPGRGPAGAKLCLGPCGQSTKVLLRTCHVKGQIPGAPASQEGGTGSCCFRVRRLNMKDPPGGSRGLPLLPGPL